MTCRNALPMQMGQVLCPTDASSSYQAAKTSCTAAADKGSASPTLRSPGESRLSVPSPAEPVARQSASTQPRTGIVRCSDYESSLTHTTSCYWEGCGRSPHMRGFPASRQTPPASAPRARGDDPDDPESTGPPPFPTSIGMFFSSRDDVWIFHIWRYQRIPRASRPARRSGLNLAALRRQHTTEALLGRGTHEAGLHRRQPGPRTTRSRPRSSPWSARRGARGRGCRGTAPDTAPPTQPDRL